MSALWINYQKANEFNPPHDHDGKLSFVIYLQIPEELKKENKEYKGRSCGPGGIQFLYGDGPRDAVTYMSYFPQERDMFIFPAWLKHWVSPFKSNCTRISVSGNIHDSAPLNNISKFGPTYVNKDKNDKKNNKYSYAKGTRSTEHGTRNYEVAGYRLPSVTTVLGKTKDTSFLDSWIKRKLVKQKQNESKTNQQHVEHLCISIWKTMY